MQITFEASNLSEIMADVDIFLADLGYVRMSVEDTEQVEDPTEQVGEREPAGTEGVDKDETPDQASEKPDTEKKPKKAKKPKTREPEPSTDRDPAADKKAAIDLLMLAYNDGKKDDVKALLGDFGVQKFGEIEDERGTDLLAAAEKL